MKAFALAILLLATTAQAAGWQRLQGAGMEYWLYTPASAGGVNGLMLNLHGCGQKADDLKALANWEPTAERYHMLVAIPDVLNGGVVLGCWNYFGKGHTETNNHNGPLIALAESLLASPALHVDKDKIYISGLSSGATQAMLVGCLRPDLFSGVAVNSGPALGSEMSEIGRPHSTAAEVAAYCLKLAGSRSFERQKAALVRGDQDFVVSTEHTTVNSEALALVYGSSLKVELDSKTFPGANPQGTAELFSTPAGVARVMVIVNQGLAHNWPSGTGKGEVSRYVNPNSVDFPQILGTFFTPSKSAVFDRGLRGAMMASEGIEGLAWSQFLRETGLSGPETKNAQ